MLKNGGRLIFLVMSMRKKIIGRLPRKKLRNPYYGAWNAFKGIAEARESILAHSDDHSFEEGGRFHADQIRAYLEPGMTVLDVGCGIGRIDKYLAPFCGELYGVDISKRMIAAARDYLADHPNVCLETNNGLDLSLFPNEKFDFVFCFLVLQHIEREDAYRYIVEIRRVLKPGGRALLQFPKVASNYFQRVFLKYMNEGHPYDVDRSRLYTTSEVIYYLSAAGFDLGEIKTVGEEVYYLVHKRPPTWGSFQRASALADPITTLGVYANMFPSPPTGKSILVEGNGIIHPDTARIASKQAFPKVIPEEEGWVLSADEEAYVQIGEEDWRDYLIRVELELLEPWDGGKYPDVVIGLRSARKDNGYDGPYVQTDSGNAFALRHRKGEDWESVDGYQCGVFRLSQEPQAMVLVARGPYVSFYRDKQCIFVARIEEETGAAYLRLARTTVRIRKLEARAL